MPTDRKSYFRVALFFLPLILLHSLVLTPIYLRLIYDVQWANTVAPSLVGWALLLLEYAVYWLIFALFLRAKKSGVAYLFAALVSFLHHGVELIMGYVVMGFPTREAFFESDFGATLWEWGFDLLLFLIALLVVRLIKKPIRLWLLALLPSVFHIISLVVFLVGFPSVMAEGWIGILIDFVLDILCIFAGRGAIPTIEKLLGRGTLHENI